MNRNAVVWAALFLSGCGGGHEAPATKKQPDPAAKILQFYASPGAIGQGETTLLCYGVENARSVRLEPAVEAIAPSSNRCIQVAPKQRTKYTLTARGAGGDEASQSLEVKVGPAKPKASVAGSLIRFFLASSPQIPAGGQVTLCYGVENARQVRIEPNVRPLEPKEKSCFSVAPTTTTTYKLLATGMKGEKDMQEVTVRVQ